MSKQLSEMTLEELWELFHIIPSEHRDIWDSWYDEEKKRVLTDNGQICMSESNDRKSFNRGYTNEGFAERVFHLYLRYAGDNDEI